MGAPGSAHLPAITLLAVLCTISATGAAAAGVGVTVCRGGEKATVYNYQFLKLHQRSNVSMDAYRGKVLLVVNVATYCDYNPQYLEMNAPVRHLAPHFDMVGFPCNQFGLQEPGLNHEILNGLRYVRPGGGFVPEFTMTAKVDVNGPNEHPLYTFMKYACSPAPGFTDTRGRPRWPYTDVKDVTWNFEKFLIDSKGKPRFRFSPRVSIPEVLPFVRDLIQEVTSPPVHTGMEGIHVERGAVGDEIGKGREVEDRGEDWGKKGAEMSNHRRTQWDEEWGIAEGTGRRDGMNRLEKGKEMAKEQAEQRGNIERGQERGTDAAEDGGRKWGREREEVMVNMERGQERATGGGEDRGREWGKEREEGTEERVGAEREAWGSEWDKLSLLLKLQHIMKESLNGLFNRNRFFIASRSADDF